MAVLLIGITLFIFGWLPDRQTHPDRRRLIRWLAWQGGVALLMGMAFSVWKQF
ncbi:MAG TPA: hypothetical protein VI136_02325 [Verrucomicrobiae bacterium]